MADDAIPVDLFNPGQVFACLGFLEAAEILLGDADGFFDWSSPSDPRFRLRVPGEASPVALVLAFVARAEVRARVVRGSPNAERWKGSWGPPPEVLDRRRGYPIPDPDSPATLAGALVAGSAEVPIHHWGDRASGRDNVKFWAGAGGYPGVALARDALDAIRARLANARVAPFSLWAPQSSSFRFDWRRDYIPIDAGFSLNDHSDITPVGFPLVELLASVGLTHARPRRPDARDKLRYEYGVVGKGSSVGDRWLPPMVLRAALGGAELPMPTRRFCMRLSWPGQENQARAITTVTEEVLS